MKILQTVIRFYPYIGGTEQVVFCLSKELTRRGHDVKVLCASEGAAAGKETIEKIKVERLPYSFKIANTNISFSLPLKLIKEDCDVIHTHLPHPWIADFSALAAKFKKKPLFLSYHNDVPERGWYKPVGFLYNRTMLRFLLDEARVIFVHQKNYINTSPFLKKFIKKIIVVPLGVDGEKFKPLAREAVDDVGTAFFLSKLDRFHEYKGLRYLLEAVGIAKKKIPLRLYVGGEGELRNRYQKMARDLGVADSVTFLGKLSDEEIVKYYNLCDCLVLPSTSSVQEGFGLVAVEAMACGKPVIVSDIVAAAGDVKECDAGIVVKPADTAGLAEAITALLSDRRRLSRCGENAYRVTRQKYTWENYTDVVEEQYRKTG